MAVEASITLEVDEIQSGAMQHRRLTAARPWWAGLPKHDAIWAETVPFRPMALPVVARYDARARSRHPALIVA